jgi:hypothetical protein
MADTVANTVIARTKTHLVTSHAFTIDGTEAADLILIDKSTFTGPDGTEPGRIVLEKLQFFTTGCQVLVEFEHTTDDAVATLSGYGVIDFTDGGRYQGFVDPASAGTTGDLVATTLNTDAGDTIYLLSTVRFKD